MDRLRSIRWRRWRKPLQALAVVIVLLFWAQTLASNWQELANFSWHVSWPWLLASLALLVVQMVLLASIWWRALCLMGAPVGWRLGTSLWLKTQIARYVPGGIWDIAGRLALGHEAGISVRAMSASIVLEMVLQVLSASIFLLVALLIRANAEPTLYVPLAALLLLASVVFLMPPVFRRLINWGLRVLRREPLDITATYGDMLVLFGARLVGHLMLGVGFVLFARGVSEITWQQAPAMIAAYVGAWLIGFLAVVVPMGIGVREGVLALLLQNQFPFGVIGVMALGYRTWMLVRDLIAALIGVWLGRGIVPTAAPHAVSSATGNAPLEGSP
ncbi:MAG: flippase-like domain-containing protein [Anaerolineae bacterium]|nr:flippase-like domain-containing protein [Anaerolineae bacterium]MCB0204786.1 flippase-like domain-containing protein [Anaerolineae bacterium]MCB0253276.1 flippase-like domain-containing protein [Anaerolineae bacterium]